MLCTRSFHLAILLCHLLPVVIATLLPVLPSSVGSKAVNYYAQVATLKKILNWRAIFFILHLVRNLNTSSLFVITKQMSRSLVFGWIAVNNVVVRILVKILNITARWDHIMIIWVEYWAQLFVYLLFILGSEWIPFLITFIFYRDHLAPL